MNNGNISLLQSMADALAGPAVVTNAGLRVVAFNHLASEVAPNLRREGVLALAIRAPEILEAARAVAAGAAAN